MGGANVWLRLPIRLPGGGLIEYIIICNKLPGLTIYELPYLSLSAYIRTIATKHVNVELIYI